MGERSVSEKTDFDENSSGRRHAHASVPLLVQYRFGTAEDFQIDYAALVDPEHAQHGAHKERLSKLLGLLVSFEEVQSELDVPLHHVLDTLGKSIEEGAATSCYVATSPLLGETSGEYFEDCNAVAVVGDNHMHDRAMASRLWLRSEELTKGYLVKHQQRPDWEDMENPFRQRVPD